VYSAYKSKVTRQFSCQKDVFSEIVWKNRRRVPAAEARVEVIPQSRTGSRETPIAKFVVCSWHDQLPDVIGMGSHRATTDRARGWLPVFHIVLLFRLSTTADFSFRSTFFRDGNTQSSGWEIFHR